MQEPKFTSQDIKYSVDEAVLERAKKLFKSEKVGKISEDNGGYCATVQGGDVYFVSISRKNIDYGHCDCYMGQKNQLCKHMIALGLAVLDLFGKIENTSNDSPENLKEVKQLVSKGIRKIKPYVGPSKIWFSYQRKLDIAAGIIEEAVKNLLANKENAKYLWSLVLKLSDKLATGGIDDSNGTIGGCISKLVKQCGQFAINKNELRTMVQEFTKDDTGFGFEDELKQMLKSTKT